MQGKQWCGGAVTTLEDGVEFCARANARLWRQSGGHDGGMRNQAAFCGRNDDLRP